VIGDTGLGGGQAFHITAKRHKEFDLALIPIGAYEPRWFMSRYHINPAEAVQIKNIVNAKKVIGHHWGTFQLTDEAITKPIEDLKIALETHHRNDNSFIAIRPGQFEVIEA
jgi:L-ascorbate metabolism protein UlaG (beta-lactamase superfamily)